jgi:hypothetical protein
LRILKIINGKGNWYIIQCFGKAGTWRVKSFIETGSRSNYSAAVFFASSSDRMAESWAKV